MSNSQLVFIRYSSSISDKIRTVFANITQDYATISVIQNLDNINNSMVTFQKKIQLKKRKMYLIVLLGQEDIPQNLNYDYTVLFYSSANSEFNLKQIIISGEKSLEEIIQDTIRALKLNFIWLGLLSRLGSDIQEFSTQLVKLQDFQQIQIGFLNLFLGELDKLISNGNLSLRQCLISAYNSLQSQKLQMDTMVQNFVRQKFNSRFLIKDIAFNRYFQLLLSRNYFQLIYIQNSTLDRFQRFKNIIKSKFQNIYHQLSLENFLEIDDYWYSVAIQKCVQNSTLSINRIQDKRPFADIINGHYFKILRDFRPNFDQYFLSVCDALKDRAGCIKEAIGAIIVKNKRIIATGYNGTPVNSINCYKGGCNICNNSETIHTQVLSCNCIHAEYSCILEAGIKITPGCTLYSTRMPCLWCTKLIIQAKIDCVVYVKNQYPSLKHSNEQVIRQTFKKAKIKLKQLTHYKIFSLK